MPQFASGKEQVISVKLIKESKMSQKTKEIPMPKRFFLDYRRLSVMKK
jgi:hypothetical protein